VQTTEEEQVAQPTGHNIGVGPFIAVATLETGLGEQTLLAKEYPILQTVQTLFDEHYLQPSPHGTQFDALTK
jgi:hypothetical protein